MVARTIVESDLSGSGEAETVRFGLQDECCEIDLTREEFDALHSLLEPYLAAGRLCDSFSLGKRRVVPETTVDEREEVRDWARGQGYELAHFGRIPVKSCELTTRFTTSTVRPEQSTRLSRGFEGPAAMRLGPRLVSDFALKAHGRK